MLNLYIFFNQIPFVYMQKDHLVMTRQKKYLGVRGCILKFRHLCPPLSVNHRFTFILFQEQGQLLSNKKKQQKNISDVNGTQN